MPNNFISPQEAKVYEIFLQPTPAQFDEIVKNLKPEPREWSVSDRLMVFAEVNFNNRYSENYAVECPVCKKPYMAFWKVPFKFNKNVWCYSCQTGIGAGL